MMTLEVFSMLMRWLLTAAFAIVIGAPGPVFLIMSFFMFSDMCVHHDGQGEYTWNQSITSFEFGAWNLALLFIISMVENMQTNDIVVVSLVFVLLLCSVGMVHVAWVSSSCDDDLTKQKVFQQAWQLIVHLGFSIWELRISGWEYLFNGRLSFAYGCEQNKHMQQDIHLLMICQLGLWIYTAYSCLYLEHKRKDFRVMMTHHLATIILVGGCIFYDVEYQGFAVLIIHDVSDVFLDVAKISNYIHYENVASVFFTMCTLFIWPWLRLYVFDWWIVGFYYECEQVERMPHIFVFTILLYCLHWWWWFLMLKILYHVLIVGQSTVAVGQEHYE